MPTGYAVLWLLVGLIILPISSQFLVEGAIYIALSLHVSEAVVGLTIVALGTSLPELAAALTSRSAPQTNRMKPPISWAIAVSIRRGNGFRDPRGNQDTGTCRMRNSLSVSVPVPL